jgi:GT2 family glycosyltransferase
MYADELELGHAIHRVGGQAWLAERVVVTHKESGSGGPQSHNPLFLYYSRRNTVLLAKRLLPAWTRWPFHVWNFMVCLKRIAENVLCRRPQAARAIAYGWLDGYRGAKGKWWEHDRQWQGARAIAPLQREKPAGSPDETFTSRGAPAGAGQGGAGGSGQS